MRRLTLCMLLAGSAAALSLPLSPTRTAHAQPAASADELLKMRWQRLLREADEKIADAQHRVDTARQAAETAARQAVLVTSGQSMAAKVAALEAQKQAELDLEAARKAKVDLLERARVEGVPPGYLR